MKPKQELTPEEKLLLKEQQAIAAQEEKEKKSEMALKFLKVGIISCDTAKLNSPRKSWPRKSKTHEST